MTAFLEKLWQFVKYILWIFSNRYLAFSGFTLVYCGIVFWGYRTYRNRFLGLTYSMFLFFANFALLIKRVSVFIY